MLRIRQTMLSFQQGIGGKYCLLPTFIFYLLLIPALSIAAQDLLYVSDDTELFSLYFDESQMVEVASHTLKPVTQVAENVTIITREDIEAMNAHNLGEVLQRIPGVYLDFASRDFSGVTSIFIQGSSYEHVLVLFDGIRWNDVQSDWNETNTIPVRVVERIEVIKGAAASTWGSALGGVINVITKQTGTATKPTGIMYGSYGEGNSQQYEGEMAGAYGKFGYYLYAGSQSSDGVELDRWFNNEMLYGKFSLELPHQSRLTVSTGKSDPHGLFYHRPTSDMIWLSREEVNFYTINLDTKLSDNLGGHLSLHKYNEVYTSTYQALSTGQTTWENIYDSKLSAVTGYLNWNDDNHDVVFGGDLHRVSYEPSETTTPTSSVRLYDEYWSLYLNDTITIDRWTIIPGLRYDHNSISKNLTNPSLGATYRYSANTLFRASISHGFRKPTIALKQGDVNINFFSANPDLEAEKVWTYQAGVETTAPRFCRLKATLFLHEAKDVWDNPVDPYINTGKTTRSGVELEAESIPWHNLTLLGNTTYIYSKSYYIYIIFISQPHYSY